MNEEGFKSKAIRAK